MIQKDDTKFAKIQIRKTKYKYFTIYIYYFLLKHIPLIFGIAFSNFFMVSYPPTIVPV